MQMSFFDGQKDFYNDKPIRLIELFAGYGSQALALKYLGVPFTHHRISEWATKSIQAYKDIHITDDNTDYSKDMTVEQVKAWLRVKISADYNTPMTEQQINRLPEKQVRTIYNNMQASHNVGSITQITAADLNVVDTDKFTYIMTYSFPCQDLSNAGKMAGMSKDSGTRSGLLWEVERLLGEMTERPQILLMENVPQVVGSTGIKDFAQWIGRLEELGYKNYWQLMNAKDYGIPQNRNRCFMVSLLGDYRFDFPHRIKTEISLSDFVEFNPKYKLNLKKLNQVEQKVIKKIASFNIAKTIRTSGRNSCDRHCWNIYGTNFGDIDTFCRKPLKEVSRTIRATQNKCGYTDLEEYYYYSPSEVFRLMGVKQEDFERVAKNQSTSALYHEAGDSIVTTCLMAIFGELLSVDYQTKINELVEELKQ